MQAFGSELAKMGFVVIEKASPAYSELGALQNLYHKRYLGGHALTKERFDFMIEWLDANT